MKLTLILAYLVYAFIPAQGQNSVLVTVTNVYPVQGVLHIDVYDKDDKFMYKEYAVIRNKVDITNSSISYTIKDIPDGDYAICVWHDANKNGKMDKNFLGIPKEGYGFSKNPACLIGPPNFSNCTFNSKTSKELKIKMNN